MKRLIPLVALLAGCSATSLPWPWERPSPDSPSSVPAPPSDAGAPASPAISPGSPQAATSQAATIDRYKAEVAQAILDANPAHSFSGRLPKILKSVVVLQLAVDRHGFPYEVKVLRSNGFKELETRAVQSVRAATLPKPDGMIMAGYGRVQFIETWLFGNDGRFQIRTLAGEQ